jgi:uncharacterized membrane protein YgcG
MLLCGSFFSLFVEELAGEVFDLLLSLGDFMEFKDLMLSYKRNKQGGSSSSSSSSAQPTGKSNSSKGNGGGSSGKGGGEGFGGLDLCITGKKV